MEIIRKYSPVELFGIINRRKGIAKVSNSEYPKIKISAG
jgi:hypothetical protein